MTKSGQRLIAAARNARAIARTPEERDAIVQAALDSQPKEDLPPELMERLTAVSRRLKLRSA